MARTSMEQKAVEKARRVGRETKLNEFDVTGRLMAIWRHSQDEGLEVVSRKWLIDCCLFNVRRKTLKDAFIGALITHRFLEKMGDDAYRIKGNAKHIANLVAYKKRTKPARDAKAKKSLNDEIGQKSVHQTDLTDTKFVALEEHSKVIHNDDGKALPVAKFDEKNDQEFFEKSSDVSACVSTVVSLQEQVLCANESESDSSSLNFNKKEKEEKLIEASTNFVYDEKAPVNDDGFDEACYSFMEKFESTVDFEIRPGSMAKLRYSQLIKSGMTQNQILTMIDNYANYKLPQCKPGHYPIHKKFETFLGSPGNWICKEYLNPVMDKVKARQMAKEKAEDEKYHRGIAEGTAWREANRKAIESGNKNATAEDFLKPSDILNKMNLHLKF